MQTAEEFATQYLLAIGADTDEAPALADAIRADRAAVALAVLDDVERWMRTCSSGSLSHEEGNVLEFLRSKYTAKATHD